ncbi:MAG: hypothetical protein O2788_05140 [Chloroflexi bacterium]|nr:hypothetical protein [Chloroflexota bacterium]
MDWGTAFKFSGKMALAFIGLAIVGFIMVGVGLALSAGWSADPNGSIGGGIILAGLFLLIGYVWVYIAGIAVFIKFFSDAIAQNLEADFINVQRQISGIARSLPSNPEGSSTAGPSSADPWNN